MSSLPRARITIVGALLSSALLLSLIYLLFTLAFSVYLP